MKKGKGEIRDEKGEMKKEKGKMVSHLRAQTFFSFLIFTFSFFATPFTTLHAGPRLSDSLAMYERRLESYNLQAAELCSKIKTPADRKEYDVEIQILRGDLEKLRGESRLVADETELNRMYTDCLKCLARIDEKVRLYQLDQTCDSLLNVEEVWQHRLDSILNKGKAFAERQKGDSVKLLKQDLEGYWQEVQSMSKSHEEAWGHDSRLEESYTRLRKTHDDIKALSEKERVKIGDILMKVLVAVGVITIVASVVSGSLRSRKIKKKVDDIPAIEL